MTASTVVRRHWPTVRALVCEFVTGRAPRPAPTRAGTRCPGSLGRVLSWRLVVGGCTGCEVCGHIVNIAQHPDGGPDAHVAPHNLEGNEL